MYQKVLASLFIYILIFNSFVQNTIEYLFVQKLNLYNSLTFQQSLLKTFLSPQTFFILASTYFYLCNVSLHGSYFKNNFYSLLDPKRCFKDIALGFAYAMITPVLVCIAYGIWMLFDFQQSNVLNWPWHGHMTCPAYSSLSLFMLWIMAPISEEIYFRSILFPSLKKNFKLWPAIALSSLIFMSTHGMFHLGSLVLGVVCAFMAYKHKNILSCIVYHIVANAYIPIMCWYFPNITRLFEKISSWLFVA